ncbi:hypothetical protein tpqmel_0648 [Candidatus Gastranaerophilus sp. (ex Termes propinquus)]|nr:hypothetical protein tpqmel_0648 [Candidatus Gastranaerophilus sp. (ex Termes propinquus)]
MTKQSEHKIFFVGMALSNSSNYDTGVAVLDSSRKLISLDKLYSVDDIALYFENYKTKKQSVFAISTPSDNTLLEGKWRIHSKNYKMLDEKFEINRNSWTNRNSPRCSDIFLELKNSGVTIFRYDIFQLRQAYGLEANYVSRSSLDCKNLQSALKLKYGFSGLPENMLPASNLEAILGAMFAYDVHNGADTRVMYEYMGLDVLSKI